MASLTAICASWFAGVAVWFGFRHNVTWSAIDAGLSVYWLTATIDEYLKPIRRNTTNAFKFGDLRR